MKLARPLIGPFMLGALLVLSSGASTASAQQADPEGEEAMFERINALRAEAGLSTLERHESLDAAARTHSVDMAWHQMLEHVSPRTGTPADRVSATGVEAAGLAENIAFNGSAADAQAGLEGSPPHHQNMLASDMSHVGISIVYADGGVYATQVFATLDGGDAAEEAVSAPSVPVVAPAPPPPVAAPAPALPPASPAAAAPQAPLVGQNGQQVAGYWVHHAGRWYYYPMPPNAQPGQRLQPDLSVTGPPPAELLRQARPGLRVQVVAPPVQRRRYYVRPVAPPPPVYHWSSHHHHDYHH